jgi:hypothetical protein
MQAKIKNSSQNPVSQSKVYCYALSIYEDSVYVASNLSYLMAIFKLSELNENCGRKKFK